MKHLTRWTLVVLLASCCGFAVACSDSTADEDAGGQGGQGTGGTTSEGLGTCDKLCAATVDECSGVTAGDCEVACVGLSYACPTEADAYLECASDKTELVCLGNDLGVVIGCESEAQAVNECYEGLGGAGGGGGSP